jgi:hypothetical protein
LSAAKSSRLTAQCVPCTELSAPDVEEMFQIHTAHYDSDESTFRADLAKKSWVIQIFDQARTLRGFCTVVLWNHRFAGRDINIVFAGDTVVDRRYWGHRALPVKWLEVTGALRARNPDAPLYWLLTSMHPRTYRFMPLYYRRFFPNWRGEEPELGAIAASVARARFDLDFDSARGVVVGEAPLKPSIAAFDGARLGRKDFRYFVERNPGYLIGEGLVCLAAVEEANHRPTALRYFLRGAATVLADRERRLGAAA